MKKLLSILLLTIPFIGFGQDINNTVWKTIDDDGDQRIIMFKEDFQLGSEFKGNYVFSILKKGRIREERINRESEWKIEKVKIIFCLISYSC